MIGALIEAVHRREHGRIIAGLIRHTGSFDVAEEALQDAYEKAMQRWPREGVPVNPAAWLTTVARNAALDRIRRDSRVVPDSEAILDALQTPDDEGLQAEHSGLPDDRLRLIFTCCHPSLAPASAAALALRTLCGLSTREVARAFVEPEATTAQKIVRIKKKIAEAHIPYVVPEQHELPGRLAAVLAVVYLVFNEGYTSAQQGALLRVDLCTEAIRLGRLLHELLPGEPECTGLLALMVLNHARRDARADAGGVLITLDEQDRTRWHHHEISEGIALLDVAMLARKPGPYQIQAAIAALHSQAETAAQTDWRQISALYGALLRHWPTPVVELNAAVALAMSAGIAPGLAWIDRIADGGELQGYPLLHAARADLLRRAGRAAEAAAEYRLAIEQTLNESERAYLQRRLEHLS
jgi:RNA polymerase sigma-70 factor (ECF subfamily)